MKKNNYVKIIVNMDFKSTISLKEGHIKKSAIFKKHQA